MVLRLLNSLAAVSGEGIEQATMKAWPVWIPRLCAISWIRSFSMPGSIRENERLSIYFAVLRLDHYGFA